MQSKKREPLYIQIYTYYKKEILAKKLVAHTRIPTEREIMKKFNVSRITVSNALARLVKEGLIYRIPGKGSFVAHNPQAEVIHTPEENHPISDYRLSRKRQVSNPKVIGLIMPSIEDYFAIRLIAGVNEALRGTNYMLTIILSHNSKELERAAIRELLNHHAAGLLIFPVDAEIYNEDILELKVRNYPFVLIDRYLPGVETNYVVSDNVEGAKLAVSYLWDMGHRNIAICSDAHLPTITVEQRIQGYMKALEEREAEINQKFILTNFTIESGKVDSNHKLYQFISNPSISAVIALNGRLGIHIANIANEMGLHIPEDLSIITFDDPSFGAYTHISQSEQLIGKEAASILIQLLEDQVDSYSKREIAPKLVIKDTTGATKKINDIISP